MLDGFHQLGLQSEQRVSGGAGIHQEPHQSHGRALLPLPDKCVHHLAGVCSLQLASTASEQGRSAGEHHWNIPLVGTTI